MTDAILELHADTPARLEEARLHWGIPSGVVNDVLKRFKKLRG